MIGDRARATKVSFSAMTGFLLFQSINHISFTYSVGFSKAQQRFLKRLAEGMGRNGQEHRGSLHR